MDNPINLIDPDRRSLYQPKDSSDFEQVIFGRITMELGKEKTECDDYDNYIHFSDLRGVEDNFSASVPDPFINPNEGINLGSGETINILD